MFSVADAKDNTAAKAEETPNSAEASDKSGGFMYSDFFKQKIAAKKADHSYRVFRKIARSAENFPYAKEFTKQEKDVNIWCSNDYLGKALP